MLRVASFGVLVASLFILASYRSGGPTFLERPLPVNSTVASLFFSQEHAVLGDWALSPSGGLSDTLGGLRILMLNYTAYDSAYVGKMRGLISNRLPNAILTDFWEGSSQDLAQAVDKHQLVVVTYPANGSARQVRAYGKVLKQYVQQGGAVVFSGTDQFGILQQYGLFDLDFGYFCSGLEVHEDAFDHPVFASTPTDFSLANYIYPLDVSDPGFVALADLRGYPTIGYKNIGAGKVVYLGLEYYYDEVVSSQILENTLRWLDPNIDEGNSISSTQLNAENTTWPTRTGRRSEERLFVGTGNAAALSNKPAFDLKVYPNPYFDKATLDVNLEKSAPVSVEMTDESGGVVAVLLPSRVLNQGFYRLEVPNVPSGVYFVKCRIGNQTTVKKVVKVATQ